MDAALGDEEEAEGSLEVSEEHGGILSVSLPSSIVNMLEVDVS